jgi:hypothetical protein
MNSNMIYSFLNVVFPFVLPARGNEFKILDGVHVV